MPIFSKKTRTYKPVPRENRLANCPKLDEDSDDYKNITMNLMGKELKFVDGAWLNVGGAKTKGDDVVKLKAKVQAIEEENNLNKIKVEVLLDMLAEHAAAQQSGKGGA